MRGSCSSKPVVTVRNLRIGDADGYEASLPRIDVWSGSLGRALQQCITEPSQELYASSRYLLNRLMMAHSALQSLHRSLSTKHEEIEHRSNI